jgi:hypothetical protein
LATNRKCRFKSYLIPGAHIMKLNISDGIVNNYYYIKSSGFFIVPLLNRTGSTIPKNKANTKYKVITDMHLEITCCKLYYYARFACTYTHAHMLLNDVRQIRRQYSNNS